MPVRRLDQRVLLAALALAVPTLAIVSGPARAASAARAGDPDALPEDDLFALSIEELVEVQVSSVAGVEQDWFASPAAVTVITGEQLRRSGHRWYDDDDDLSRYDAEYVEAMRDIIRELTQ